MCVCVYMTSYESQKNPLKLFPPAMSCVFERHPYKWKNLRRKKTVSCCEAIIAERRRTRGSLWQFHSAVNILKRWTWLTSEWVRNWANESNILLLLSVKYKKRAEYKASRQIWKFMELASWLTVMILSKRKKMYRLKIAIHYVIVMDVNSISVALWRTNIFSIFQWDLSHFSI